MKLRQLPLKNLLRRPGRTAALVLLTAFLALSVFCGSVVVRSLQSGLDSLEARLGADIIVMPATAESKVSFKNMLLQGTTGAFYMDASVVDEIRSIEGVEAASPQLFLASAKAGCCSARLQMIAYDPATDFTIRPWINDTSVSKEPGLMDVIIGSNVSWTSAATDNVIRFYDTECNVIGQFEPTGSTLDSAVYMNFDTCKALIQACRDKGMFKYENLDGDKVISSVMVRVAPGYDSETVAEAIRNRVPGVSVATASNMVSGIADSLDHISVYVFALTAVLWLLGLMMTVLIFTMMMSARKREFASLRAMGASREILSGIVVREALMVNLLGGVAGILLTMVILFSFRTLIGEVIGAGFVLPSFPKIGLLAAAALASVMLAAALSARISVHRVNTMDAGLVLKEGA